MLKRIGGDQTRGGADDFRDKVQKIREEVFNYSRLLPEQRPTVPLNADTIRRERELFPGKLRAALENISVDYGVVRGQYLRNGDMAQIARPVTEENQPLGSGLASMNTLQEASAMVGGYMSGYVEIPGMNQGHMIDIQKYLKTIHDGRVIAPEVVQAARDANDDAKSLVANLFEIAKRNNPPKPLEANGMVSIAEEG